MDTPPATPPSKPESKPSALTLHDEIRTVIPNVISILRRLRGYLRFYHSMPKDFSDFCLHRLTYEPILREVRDGAYGRLADYEAKHFIASLPLWIKIVDNTIQVMMEYSQREPSHSSSEQLIPSLLRRRISLLTDFTSSPFVSELDTFERTYEMDGRTAEITFEMACNGFCNASRGIPRLLDALILGKDGAGCRFIRIVLGGLRDIGEEFLV